MDADISECGGLITSQIENMEGGIQRRNDAGKGHMLVDMKQEGNTLETGEGDVLGYLLPQKACSRHIDNDGRDHSALNECAIAAVRLLMW